MTEKSPHPFLAPPTELFPEHGPTVCERCGHGETHPIHAPDPAAHDNPVGRNHPENARRMGDKMRLGTKKRLAWEFIRDQGRFGATAEEVGIHYGWQHQSYSSACTKLEQEGWTEWLYDGPAKVYRPTSVGNDAGVYVIARRPSN